MDCANNVYVNESFALWLSVELHFSTILSRWGPSRCYIWLLASGIHPREILLSYLGKGWAFLVLLASMVL